MSGKSSPEQNNPLADSFISEKGSHIWDADASKGKQFARSLYFSTKCRWIYFFLILLNCLLGLWAAYDLYKNNKPHTAFYILETIVNVILAMDVILRIWIKGCRGYWKQCTNTFEFILVWSCLIITVISIIQFEHLKKAYDELATIVLMFCLCFFQYIRIGFLFTKHHHTAVFS